MNAKSLFEEALPLTVVAFPISLAGGGSTSGTDNHGQERTYRSHSYPLNPYPNDSLSLSG